MLKLWKQSFARLKCHGSIIESSYSLKLHTLKVCMGTKLTRQLENQGMGNRTGTKTELKREFVQKGWLRAHDDLVHNQRSTMMDYLPFSAADTLLDWYGYTCPLQLTMHGYCNCSSLTSPTILGDPSPTDTRQIPAVKVESLLWDIFMEDTLMQWLQGLYILCWDGKSPSVPWTVVLNILHLLPRLMSSQQHTCTMTMCTSLPIACLSSGHTHFQTSSWKKDQITITLIFELAAWNRWQTITYN